ncbi:MAG TPA: BamA/TamA family outer membrane protein, partial [Vicinamibacteria bacterium]|nr:BamA/TamA family outer membrane protein [Vicinamibacteria bacterium]
VEVPIVEGRQALVAALEFTGASLDHEELARQANVTLGEPYNFDAAVAAVQRVRDYYLRAGYARVRVHPRPTPQGADLVLRLEVREGPHSTVGPTVITGLHRTRESLVRGRVQLEPGDPLDPRELSVLERRLLDLDVFSRVVVTADESVGNEGAGDEGGPVAPGPATIKVELEEEGPYSFAYDVRFSRAERATGTIDAEVGNLLGMGLALGARYRMGADIRELRGSAHLPALGSSGDLTAAVFQAEEDFLILGEGRDGVPIIDGRPFLAQGETEVQRGFELQRATHPREGLELLYGYRFKRITSRPQRLDQTISGVEFSVVNDRRDDPLDSTQGHFLSFTVDAAPRLMGSDFTFARFLGQAFLVRPMGPLLTWAQGYRLGLARGLEEQSRQQVEVFGRSTELFRSGGANTLRGFATDSVGPPSRLAGVSRGGEAMIVLNQELRYRFPWGIGAAVFWDAGNVYERVGDVNFKLRHS